MAQSKNRIYVRKKSEQLDSEGKPLNSAKASLDEYGFDGNRDIYEESESAPTTGLVYPTKDGQIVAGPPETAQIQPKDAQEFIRTYDDRTEEPSYTNEQKLGLALIGLMSPLIGGHLEGRKGAYAGISSAASAIGGALKDNEDHYRKLKEQKHLNKSRLLTAAELNQMEEAGKLKGKYGDKLKYMWLTVEDPKTGRPTLLPVDRTTGEPDWGGAMPAWKEGVWELDPKKPTPKPTDPPAPGVSPKVGAGAAPASPEAPSPTFKEEDFPPVSKTSEIMKMSAKAAKPGGKLADAPDAEDPAESVLRDELEELENEEFDIDDSGDAVDTTRDGEAPKTGGERRKRAADRLKEIGERRKEIRKELADIKRKDRDRAKDLEDDKAKKIFGKAVDITADQIDPNKKPAPKNDAEYNALPPEKRKQLDHAATTLAKRNSYLNGLESDLAQFKAAKTDDEKIKVGQSMLKALNSSENPDAVGVEESRRLGSLLEYQKGNIFNPGPFIGTDLPGFQKQVEAKIRSMQQAAKSDQRTIDKLYNRESAPDDEMGAYVKGNIKVQTDQLKPPFEGGVMMEDPDSGERRWVKPGSVKKYEDKGLRKVGGK